MFRILARLFILLFGIAWPASLAGGQVVISQVFGAGGNTGGAQYRHDFIELFNRGSNSVNLTGWSVQATTAMGTVWATTPLSGVIPTGAYYLIQEDSGGGAGVPLPPPDAFGTIPLSSTSAKVALLSNATQIPNGTACPTASVIDLVGYGSSTCFEGSGAGPMLTNTTAVFRLDSGCTDTADNAADFIAAAPAPRNSASATHPCSGGTCQGTRGDMDNSGSVDGVDVQRFVDCLLIPGPPAGACLCADMDQNNVLNAADVSAFTTLLAQ